ncbi:hypothetical protein [Staphylococcus sp. 11262D007BW]
MRANSEQANLSLGAKSSAELKPIFGFSEASHFVESFAARSRIKQSYKPYEQSDEPNKQ